MKDVRTLWGSRTGALGALGAGLAAATAAAVAGELSTLNAGAAMPTPAGRVAAQTVDAARARPNIVLMLVDDVGYCDIGAFAARVQKTSTDRLYLETPRLDRLAKEGEMFTQFYVCTVCSPSRASLLTGKMNNRMGMWDAYGSVDATFEKTGKTPPAGCHLLDQEYRYGPDRGVTIPVAATVIPKRDKILPEALSGYHAAFIGKWHLGSHGHAGCQPKDRGFDEVLAYYDSGGSTYYRPFRSRGQPWENPGPDLTPRQDYLSDDIAQRVNRFLEDRATKHPDEPFFLYVAHPACHAPIQSRADDEAYFKKKAETSGWIGHLSPAYAGLVKGMDRSIGAMLDKLDELKLAENTVVIFLSDNGGHPEFTRNTPLRGGKSMLYEGGIRVPMIVRWPGQTRPGTVCDVPVEIADIYPTIMDIAGVDYGAYQADKAADGQTLRPLFSDAANAKKAYTRTEFYHFYGKMGYKGFHNYATWATLRKGDYKLHYDYQGKVELYNIVEDMFEKNDLVQTQPKRAHDMLVQLTDWLAAHCNEAYLPKPNPAYDPKGPQPYGPYIPLEELKAKLKSGR